ncbi:hypothetical protein T484DRAFT_1744127 [Baffinella frigidus]|nr:hypothetical protein T484DRAFT_1744127 [Cryptophyta sp. CCMP2293]
MEPDFDVPIADGQRSRSESHLSNSDEAMALRISQDYQEIRDGEDLVREYTAELAELAELAASRSGEADSSLSPAWHPSRPGAAASALTPIALSPAASAGVAATPAELARAPARAPGRPTRKSVSMDNVGDALKVYSTPSRPFCTGKESNMWL